MHSKICVNQYFVYISDIIFIYMRIIEQFLYIYILYNIIVLVLGRLILRIWMQPLQPYPCPYRLLPDSP